MLMPALAQHPKPLQPAPHLSPRLAGLLRQRQAQGPVRIAQPERLDQLWIAQSPFLQIAERIGRLLERCVIKPRHLAQKLCILRRRR